MIDNGVINDLEAALAIPVGFFSRVEIKMFET